MRQSWTSIKVIVCTCAKVIYTDRKRRGIKRRDRVLAIKHIHTCQTESTRFRVSRSGFASRRSDEKISGSREKFGFSDSRTLVQLPRIQHLHNVYKRLSYPTTKPPQRRSMSPPSRDDDGLTATEVITDAFQGAPTEYRNYADGVIIFATRLLGSILN